MNTKYFEFMDYYFHCKKCNDNIAESVLVILSGIETRYCKLCDKDFLEKIIIPRSKKIAKKDG